MERKLAPGAVFIRGEEVQRWRNARLMTQRELAEAAQLSQATIHQLETGKRDYAYPGTVKKLARALGVEPAQILRADGDE